MLASCNFGIGAALPFDSASRQPRPVTIQKCREADFRVEFDVLLEALAQRRHPATLITASQAHRAAPVPCCRVVADQQRSNHRV